MDSFAPELSQRWLNGPEPRGSSHAPHASDDPDRREEARREAQALEDLAGRVSAARSVL